MNSMDEPKSPEKKPVSAAEPEGEKPLDPSPLTPEEQMALYEEDLKESDWGHQPC